MARLTLEEFVEEPIGIAGNPEAEQVIADEIGESPTEELTEAVSEVKEDLEAQERSLDIAESLEAIHETLFGKTEITDTERKLLCIASGMAVAGTPFKPTQIIPSLESNDVNVALEGISESLKNILTGIVNFFKKIVDGIKKVFSKLIFSLRTYDGKLKTLRSRLLEMKKNGVAELKDVSIKARRVHYIENKKINTSNELLKQVKIFDESLMKQFSAIFDFARVIESEAGIFRTIKDLAKINETGARIFKDALDFTNDFIKAAGFKQDRSVGSGIIYTSKQVLGNEKVSLRVPNPKDFNLTDIASLKRVSHLFAFNHVEDLDPRKGEKTSEFKSVKIDDLIGIVDDSLDFLNKCNNFAEDSDRIFNSASFEVERLATQIINIPVVGAISYVAIYNFIFSFRMMVQNNALIVNGISKVSTQYLNGLNGIIQTVYDFSK